MKELQLITIQRHLLNDALGKLNTYASALAVHSPRTAVVGSLNQHREDYVNAIVEVVKHFHEMERTCNIVASSKSNAYPIADIVIDNSGKCNVVEIAENFYQC